MPLTSATSNFPNGVTNAAPWQAMAESIIPDPSFSQVYHNEFNTYQATDFTTTLVGTGTAALSAEIGGVLLDTTTAGAADAVYHQLPVASFGIVPSSALYFKARFKADSTLPAIICGLISTSATPISAPDGIWFVKNASSANVILRHRIGGVTTDVALPTSLTVVANTWVELSFYYDGKTSIAAFFNPSTGAVPRPVSSATANPGYVAISTPAALTTAVLNPTFGILNSTAVARTIKWDYITVSCEL